MKKKKKLQINIWISGFTVVNKYHFFFLFTYKLTTLNCDNFSEKPLYIYFAQFYEFLLSWKAVIKIVQYLCDEVLHLPSFPEN